MQERFEKINELLANYSLGNFDFKAEISEQLDEIDTITVGINMLGEELKATTISKNYFNDIFNSVSDMVFVLSKTGLIENINKTVSDKLGYSKDTLYNKKIAFLTTSQDTIAVSNIKKIINKHKTYSEAEIKLKTSEGAFIPVLFSMNFLRNPTGESLGYIVIAKDITKQKETENLIIRTIVNTQENERKRVAKDLHDSLGQQLSAIKFYLGTLAVTTDTSKSNELLYKSNEGLNQVMKELRNICFNLMPQTLENSNIINAIKELCNKWKVNETFEIEFITPQKSKTIEKSIEIALYRIVQEFIHNSIRHGKAKKIVMQIAFKSKTFQFKLQDNGIGFDLSKPHSWGMGLKNVSSRVKSYNGTIQITSEPNFGTSYDITLPLKTTL